MEKRMVKELMYEVQPAANAAMAIRNITDNKLFPFMVPR